MEDSSKVQRANARLYKQVIEYNSKQRKQPMASFLGMSVAEFNEWNRTSVPPERYIK